MSAALPPPSRRVLDALLGDAPQITDDGADSDATPVQRALRDLFGALAAHEAALSALDHLEDTLVVAHGHPRVPLPPDPAGVGLAYAADPTTIDRRLGDGPLARRLKAELRRRQAVVREAVAARALGAAGAALLIAPCRTLRDLRLKLAVLIAAGEPGPDDASAFPWWCLRILTADLDPSLSQLEQRA